MKNFGFKEKLFTSTKKALEIFKIYPTSNSGSHGNCEKSVGMFIRHDELKKVKSQILEMEILQAQAIQIIRDRNRCI
jgi:hypothetical protein